MCVTRMFLRLVFIEVECSGCSRFCVVSFWRTNENQPLSFFWRARMTPERDQHPSEHIHPFHFVVPESCCPKVCDTWKGNGCGTQLLSFNPTAVSVPVDFASEPWHHSAVKPSAPPFCTALPPAQPSILDHTNCGYTLCFHSDTRRPKLHPKTREPTDPRKTPRTCCTSP